MRASQAADQRRPGQQRHPRPQPSASVTHARAAVAGNADSTNPRWNTPNAGNLNVATRNPTAPIATNRSGARLGAVTAAATTSTTEIA
jgi:hypothetical protein